MLSDTHNYWTNTMSRKNAPEIGIPVARPEGLEPPAF
jgi:hypothetical protein